jgi:23S rRNA (guanosine2251-2'-O)-methyltransferase
MKEWIYGRYPVYECLRAGRRHFFNLRVAQGAQEKGQLAEIVQMAQKAGVKVYHVPRQQLEQVSEHHQGVALQVSGYPYAGLEQMLALAQERGEPPFILILDALQDPQNLGSLLRTAEAVGVHGVLLPLRQTAAITPAVVNSSSGASEHLLVGKANLAQAIQELKQLDVWVVGLDAGPQAQLPDQLNLKGALALVVGSEGEGMRRLVQQSCDMLLRLPMRGRIESLNAAAAGSVALYLVWSARGYSGAEG